jgi:hypothetical protein
MIKTVTMGLSVLSLAVLITGCGQNVPAVVSNMNNEDKCDAYNKQLMKVDQYLETVEKTSAFHLEEAAVALENPQISTSNNKKDMLRDATKRKINILENMKTYGCVSYKK